MKNLLTAFVLGAAILTAGNVNAQKIEETGAIDYQIPDENDFPHHNIKLNVLALVLTNVSVQYEYSLTRKMSVALGVRYQPSTGLPFKDNINSFVDQQSESSGDAKVVKEFIDNTKTDNWAITPEFRYYFGKKPNNGFYLAPFVRFGGYSMSTSYNYTDDADIEHKLPFKGNGSSLTGGLMIGAQWHVGKHISLDWWILGPSYGSINLDLDARVDLSMLTEADRAELVEILDDELGLDAEVTDEGATATGKMPFGGLRTGFCIGYTF